MKISKLFYIEVKMRNIFIYAGCILLCVSCAFAAVQSEVLPFDSPRWDIRAKESKITEYLNRKALYLQGGVAMIKDSDFTDGTIEFDIAFSGERGFMGTFWRLQDLENYEEFYLRPHQSGQPDANQYEPVFHGVAAWQLYYGEGYAAPVKYKFNEWFHVKVVVSNRSAEMYIEDMDKPVLFVPQMKREVRSGKVGLSVADFAPAYFANFSFSSNVPELKGSAPKAVPEPEGTVSSWMISNPFPAKLLDSSELSESQKGSFAWKKFKSEKTGIANLAEVSQLSKDNNTVFARLVIHSDVEQVKKFTFGFSDSVKVFFNDRLIFGGDDSYRSRDHRFLGTVGLYDELYLPLKKGTNEIWMAITENFGGWGVKGAIDNRSGIRIEE
jgi:hypothetical protein